ncbi:MAG TPA: hypothetical protein DEB39_05755 [Planctomycetaceae bacterium]|nr:hypothetical protein [Planctomycetaceae bacterium]
MSVFIAFPVYVPAIAKPGGPRRTGALAAREEPFLYGPLYDTTIRSSCKAAGLDSCPAMEYNHC